MTERGEDLDAQRLRALLQDLSERLTEQGLEAQLFVVGGAAMALEYDGGRLTRDVDAIFEPAAAIRRIVEDLGEAYDLEPDWLNDGAKGFMPGQDENPRTVFESTSLLVQVPSPEYLLAMKLHASRDERDLVDAARLFNIAGFSSAAEAYELLERTYTRAQLLPRHRYVVEDVVQRAAVSAIDAESKASGAESATEPRRNAAEMHDDGPGSGPSLRPGI